MFNVKLTEEQRLYKATVKLMGMPAILPLSPILMLGKRSICDKAR